MTALLEVKEDSRKRSMSPVDMNETYNPKLSMIQGTGIVEQNHRVQINSTEFVRAWWGETPTAPRGMTAWIMKVHTSLSPINAIYIGFANAIQYHQKTTLPVIAGTYIICINVKDNRFVITKVESESAMVMSTGSLPFSGPFVPYVKMRGEVQVSLHPVEENEFKNEKNDIIEIE